MPPQRLHPNGQRKIKISHVKQVYGDVVEIPYHCYGAGSKGNTLVTPEQVASASDQFDAEGILEDIDTQWGSIPQGGALDYCGYGSD
ncbi:hypothetical protein DL96DRAFT_1629524 [Flagelloscypha sp. PMI_526]|nr:hypothetical protein DL96DRAFT_1629524 [Flagelloscypha sp. PMI_526]